MKKYDVEYMLYACDKVKTIEVEAKNKVDAYSKAVYKLIPDKHGELPYSAWVRSVVHNNGNFTIFNTFSGKPF